MVTACKHGGVGRNDGGDEVEGASRHFYGPEGELRGRGGALRLHPPPGRRYEDRVGEGEAGSLLDSCHVQILRGARCRY